MNLPSNLAFIALPSPRRITESRQLQAAPWPLLVKAVGLKLARVLFLLCRWGWGRTRTIFGPHDVWKRTSTSPRVLLVLFVGRQEKERDCGGQCLSFFALLP